MISRSPFFYPSFFGSLNFAIAVTAIWAIYVPAPIALSDFIAGSIVFSDGEKQKDIGAIFVFLAVFAAGYKIIEWALRRFHLPDSDAAANGHFFHIPIFVSLLSLAFLGDFFVAGRVTPSLLWLSGALLLGWMGFALIGGRRAGPAGSWDMDVLAGCFVATIFFALWPVAIGIFARLFGLFLFETQQSVIVASVAAAIVGFGSMAAAMIRFRHQSLLITRLSLIIAQFPLPLLFTVLLPLEGTTRTQLLTYLVMVLTVGAFLGWGWNVWRQGLLRPGSNTAVWQTITVTSWIAIVVLLRMPVPIAPIVAASDYQIGEILTPWQQWREFGLIPYVDIMPVRGISDLLIAASNDLFYAGTGATIWMAVRLVSTILAVACFSVLRRFTGVGWAIVAVLAHRFTPGYTIGFLALALMCSPKLQQRPGLWISTYLIISAVFIFVAPIQVSAVMLALLPLLGISISKIRAWKEATLSVIGTASVILLLWLAGVPLADMTGNLLKYLWDNALNNNAAYGIPWQNSFKAKQASSFLEFARMTWIIFPVLLTVFILKAREDQPRSTARYLTVLLYILLVSPYAMGRIEVDDFSRPGLFSNMIWALVAPISFVSIKSSAARAGMLLCFGAGLLISPYYKNYLDNLFYAPLASEAANYQQKSVNGAEYGLPALGTGIANESDLERLANLNLILSTVLQPNQGYLDLTNRTTNYFYFHRPVLGTDLTPYNAPTTSQQNLFINRLKRSQPSIVLLQADNIQSSDSAISLRSTRIYRFVIENYIPVKIKKYVLAVRKQDWGVLYPALLAAVQTPNFATIDPITGEIWEKGIAMTSPRIMLSRNDSVTTVEIGDSVELANSERRRIISIEGTTLMLEGGTLDPKRVGYPHPVRIYPKVVPDKITEYPQAFDEIFRPADLQSLPTVWGRSVEALKDRLTNLVMLGSQYAILSDIKIIGNEGFMESGEKPSIAFPLKQMAISNHDVGMLIGQVHCANDHGGVIQFTLRWKGSSGGDTVTFMAANGWFIVPLEAYPQWLLQPAIDELTLSWQPSSACDRLTLSSLSLAQRNALTE